MSTFKFVLWMYNNINLEMNRCQPNPCRNMGTCNEVNGDFECACSPEYMGRDCQGKQRFKTSF